MQEVVILTPTEYEDLKASEETLLKVLENLGELKDKPTELNKYIGELLDIE